MWQKFKEQIPTIIVTAALILGVAFWFNQKTAAEMAAKQQTEITALREQNADEVANAMRKNT